MSNAKQTKKRRSRLPKKKVAKIRDLVASGKRTIAEVAELYGIPYFTAYSIVRGYSYTRTPGPTATRQRKSMSEERAARIVELHEKGASIRQLALASKFSESTIKRVLRQAKEAQP
ncbi:MAG: helix-turn-helix domain-containing protein [Acidimicrobiia bacterium]